jgi:hypothetical protein
VCGCCACSPYSRSHSLLVSTNPAKHSSVLSTLSGLRTSFVSIWMFGCVCADCRLDKGAWLLPADSLVLPSLPQSSLLTTCRPSFRLITAARERGPAEHQRRHQGRSAHRSVSVSVCRSSFEALCRCRNQTSACRELSPAAVCVWLLALLAASPLFCAMLAFLATFIPMQYRPHLCFGSRVVPCSLQ